MKRIRLICCILIFLCLPVVANAQASGPVHDPLRVFLVTFGPGEDPWEKFGHDCIVIENTDQDTSSAYNWGMFTFGEGWRGFVSFGVQFLRGRLLYLMESDPTGAVIDSYIQHGRSVLVQELRMTASQKQSLAARLRANDTDANRYYLYDYFKKNCATMCRDEIDLAIGGQVQKTLSTLPTQTTYRWHDQRTTADTLWLYLFLDYALGHAVDQPVSAWQESFLPGRFAEHIRQVKVQNAAGVWMPLVKSEQQLSTGTFYERQIPPRTFFYYFLGSGILAGSLLAGVAKLGLRFRAARWTFQLLVMCWSLLAGLLGLLLSYACFSDHQAAKWNESWLQCNVISLAMVVAGPMIHRWPNFTRKLALAIAALASLGLLLKLLPWFYQSNGNIIAIALPIHVGIALGVCLLAAKTIRPVSPTDDRSPNLAIETPHAI